MVMWCYDVSISSVMLMCHYILRWCHDVMTGKVITVLFSDICVYGEQNRRNEKWRFFSIVIQSSPFGGHVSQILFMLENTSPCLKPSCFKLRSCMKKYPALGKSLSLSVIVSASLGWVVKNFVLLRSSCRPCCMRQWFYFRKSGSRSASLWDTRKHLLKVMCKVLNVGYSLRQCQ